MEQSQLKDSKGPCLILLDYNLLGETHGPNGQALLRKRFHPSEDLTRKLVQGALLGRGGQRRDEDQCTVPCEGDIVLLHLGDKSKKPARALFRLRAARPDASLDCEEREIIVAFQDESMRTRKKLNRGSYSLQSSFLMYSESTLVPNQIPEKQYPHHGGWNTSDLVGLVKASQPSDLWHTTRRLF